MRSKDDSKESHIILEECLQDNDWIENVSCVPWRLDFFINQSLFSLYLNSCSKNSNLSGLIVIKSDDLLIFKTNEWHELLTKIPSSSQDY